MSDRSETLRFGDTPWTGGRNRPRKLTPRNGVENREEIYITRHPRKEPPNAGDTAGDTLARFARLGPGWARVVAARPGTRSLASLASTLHSHRATRGPHAAPNSAPPRRLSAPSGPRSRLTPPLPPGLFDAEGHPLTVEDPETATLRRALFRSRTRMP